MRFKEEFIMNIKVKVTFNKFKKFLASNGALVGLLVLIVGFSLITNTFLSTYNLLNIARQSAVNLILAIGMTLVVLTGGIDLSIGGVLALIGTIVAGLLSEGTSLFLSLSVGILIGLVFGLFAGFCITKAKIPPFVATLGILTIARSLALIYSGGYPITGMPKNFTFIGAGYLLSIPFPVIIASLIFIVGLFLLKSTLFGRYVYAIGGNKEASYLSGINVDRWTIGVWALNGLLVALAGIVLTARMNSGQPAAASGIELDIIAAVVIGGTSLAGGEGKLLGTLYGTLIITVLNNGLTLMSVNPYYQGAIIGLVILGAVWIDRRSKD
jgi:ribose transport system permease protein